MFKSSINDGDVASPELVGSPALVYPSEGAPSPSRGWQRLRPHRRRRFPRCSLLLFFGHLIVTCGSCGREPTSLRFSCGTRALSADSPDLRKPRKCKYVNLYVCTRWNERPQSHRVEPVFLLNGFSAFAVFLQSRAPDLLSSRVQASSPCRCRHPAISGHSVIGYELLFSRPQTWKLPTLWRLRSGKHSCHGETLHLSDVHVVTIKQQREVGNYVSQAAEDNSCTAITLICSGLWGEGVSRRGNQAEGACIRCLSESESGSCQLLALLWTWGGCLHALGISPRPSALGWWQTREVGG